MAILTDARNSVWSAIDNWPALSSSFARKLKLDHEILIRDIEPSISDFPCIAITPSDVAPSWFTNQSQHWPYTLEIAIWTPDWKLGLAEQLIQDVAAAIYQASASPGGPTYVKAATGYYPAALGPMTVKPVKLSDADDDDGTKCIRTAIQVVLRLNRNPFVA